MCFVQLFAEPIRYVAFAPKKSDHWAIVVVTAHFDQVVQCIAVETSAGSEHNAILLTAIEFVRQSRMPSIDLARGVDREKFQKMRTHGNCGTVAVGERKRDKSFGRDETFPLDRSLRE